MIQTKIPVVYGNRNEKEGIVLIEVRLVEQKIEGNEYLVIDWDKAYMGENDDPISSKKVFWDAEQIEQVNAYLEANNDFSGLTKQEVEFKKMQLALMYDTQNNLLPSGKTIHRLNPIQWELSPEKIVSD